MKAAMESMSMALGDDYVSTLWHFTIAMSIRVGSEGCSFVMVLRATAL